MKRYLICFLVSIYICGTFAFAKGPEDGHEAKVIPEARHLGKEFTAPTLQYGLDNALNQIQDNINVSPGNAGLNTALEKININSEQFAERFVENRLNSIENMDKRIDKLGERMDNMNPRQLERTIAMLENILDGIEYRLEIVDEWLIDNPDAAEKLTQALTEVAKKIQGILGIDVNK